ncbi:MAG: sigma-70 family RNA polymerase sigma factor, partial [Chloroflexi bacterium]|nr:sigma-70 family RNA polymerase sigma factor [Chloroflexota bacterium]
MDDTTSLMLEIRRALKQLYDPVYLQRSPLMALLLGRAVPPGQEARMLRQILVEAVEQLAPPESVPLRSEARRAYEALRGRYIEGLSIEELAQQSNLSERQVRRDLRLALEALTRIIKGLLEQAEAFREQAPAEGDAPIRQALETLGGDQAVNL